MTRRQVRVDPAFLELLDRQLPAERGPGGEASATDFLVLDLPPILELFAEEFDNLMQIVPGRPDYRSSLTVGRLVARVLVTGQLHADDTVTLLSIRIDKSAP